MINFLGGWMLVEHAGELLALEPRSGETVERIIAPHLHIR